MQTLPGFWLRIIYASPNRDEGLAGRGRGSFRKKLTALPSQWSSASNCWGSDHHHQSPLLTRGWCKYSTISLYLSETGEAAVNRATWHYVKDNSVWRFSGFAFGHLPVHFNCLSYSDYGLSERMWVTDAYIFPLHDWLLHHPRNGYAARSLAANYTAL